MMKSWKLKLSIIIALGLLLWWAGVGLQKQLLVQYDGHTIIAEETWEESGRIYYIRGIEILWVDASQVLEIIQGSFTDPACYIPLLTAHLGDTLKRFASTRDTGPTWGSRLRGFVVQTGIFLVWIAGALVLGFLAFLGIRWSRKRSMAKIKTGTDPTSRSGGFQPLLAGISDVEALFLNLYREKLGAPPDAPSEVKRIKDPRPSFQHVIELKVEHEGTWRSRRMTLAPIGENTGSKSQCFHVIFDTHMVVKIPPAPIIDFEDYLVQVQAESKIMRKLAPKECVIPNISVLLKKIHTFPGADRLTAEQLEKKYTQWLMKSTAHQRFLKVGKSFVFFMDLAKYYFLSQVIESFHSDVDVVEEAFQADTDILTDLNPFEDKYGKAGRELWTDLNRAYQNFQREISSAMVQSDERIDLSDWQVKNWFLARMAGRNDRGPALNVSDQFNTYIDMRLSKIDAAQSEIGQRYRQLIHQKTGDRFFDRNRPLMGAMVTNLLALLAWLDENRVAMRDLKPDNLLVAGDPANYPHFLSSAKDYAIGLIDLETAVDYERETHTAILQPKLGGTPLYGTPANFFPNKLLQEIHKDLPLIFHLQDWYAGIGIIFEVITAKKLFQHTAREIPKLMKTVMQTVAKKGDLKSAYLQFTRRFWDSSAMEFQNNLQTATRRLESVVAGISENIQQRLVTHIQQQQTKAENCIVQCLDANTAFNRGKNRRLLEQSPARDIQRIRAKYEGRQNSKKIVCRLDDLIALKLQAENLAQQMKTLKMPFPKVTAKILLEMMFDVVHTHMMPDIAVAVSEKIPRLPETGFSDATALDETMTSMEETQGLGYSVTLSLTD